MSEVESYVEQTVAWMSGRLEKQRKELEAVQRSTLDVLMTEEKPEWNAGDEITVNGVTHVALSVYSPSIARGLDLGGGAIYSVFHHHKWATLVRLVKEDHGGDS